MVLVDEVKSVKFVNVRFCYAYKNSQSANTRQGKHEEV